MNLNPVTYLALLLALAPGPAPAQDPPPAEPPKGEEAKPADGKEQPPAEGDKPAEGEQPPPAPPPPPIVHPPAPTPAQNEARLVERLKAIPQFARAATNLTADGEEFLAFYREEESAGRAQGAALLLHDLGDNAGQSQVIGPLQQRLPAKGWHTLALQLPLPAGSGGPGDALALYDRALARAKAGLAFLAQRSAGNVVLIGHGFGALLATRLAADGASGARALVTIAMADYPGDERLDSVAQMKPVTVATLDIHAGRDLFAASDSAARRRAAARHARAAAAQAGAAEYRQLAISGADHHFLGYEEQLVKAVAGWLGRYAPATPTGGN